MMRTRKIAMVAACPFPQSRGTPIRIHRMASALARRGHDVRVVTYHLGEDPEDAPFRIHRISNVPTYRKTSPGPTYQKLAVLDPLLALKLRGLLRRESFDVIHAHHYEGLLVALAARSRGKPPIVFDVHTLLESELPYYGLGLTRWVKRGIGRTLDRCLPQRADHLIVVSEEIRAKLVDEYAASIHRVSMIANGVDHEHFDVAADASPVDRDVRTLIFTGNLAAYQGIHLMLHAFKTVRDQHDDVGLVIVTEDSFEPYEQLATDLGVRPFIEVKRSTFDELPAHLATADIALNPRVDCDGVPQKLLNYMAAGRPVVSFDGSAKHLIDGEHGLVVDNADTLAFARGVNRLLNDRELSRRLGANGKNFVRSQLSWVHTARQVEAVYDHLL